MANRSGSSTTAKKAIQKKICSTCGDEKSMREFYNSYNSLHKDNKSPICKTCMKNACYDENGEFDIENFQSILRQLDRPFIQDLWDSSIAEVKKGINISDDGFYDGVIGKYMKNISIQQHRLKKWDDSVFQTQKSVSESTRRKANTYNEKVYYLNDEEFDVSEEMIRLFGEGYTSKEYQTMQRIYDDTKQDYPNISSNQKNLLLRYVRFAAKEEIATNSGIIADAEKWSKLTRGC